MARVEDEYLDVLQNIESMIVTTYRKHREMTDYDVTRVLESVIDVYRAENVGRPPRDFGLSEREVFCADLVRRVCDWRLGRGASSLEPRQGLNGLQPKTVDEILLCIKRILKSVKRWNKTGGRQGYLTFVSQFM